MITWKGMNKFSFAFTAIVSISAFADERRGLGHNPAAYDRIKAFCTQEYRREPSLIMPCTQNQMTSLQDIERYQVRVWPDIGDDHPVSRLLKASVEKSGVVVEGKPWVNWTLAKHYFKQSMQAWLEAEGKSDAYLNSL